MKIIILLVFICLIQCTTIETQQLCTCKQLSQNDCKINNQCLWNNNCNSKTTITQIIPSYCSYLNEDECSQDYGCQWINSFCNFFTGCQAYKLTTDKECKKLNKRCYKSDLTKCVEQNECKYYKEQIICFMDINNKYCYWDNEKQECQQAQNCQQLPSLLDSDEKCRQQINTCTTKSGGGCIDALINCQDIKLEIQCYYNKDQNQKCFWDNSLNPPICKIKNCDNASLTFTTDDECKNYLQECTTKYGGGCIIRSTCEAVTIKNACTYSSNNIECFWVDGQCKQKQCQNATKQIVTNIGCQSINENCITKAGGGCMQNGECSIANVNYACKLNIRGEYCYWDDITQQCKDRICINAPSNLSTHEQCSKFVQICTINIKKEGCENRTCENAPIYIQTLQACQEYYNNTCIVKKDGGCITLNLCEDIELEISCIKDKNNNQCFWYNDKCSQKICLNVPKQQYNQDTQSWIDIKLDHNYCNQYMNICTISKLGDNCINYYCDYVNDYDICIQNTQCYWRTSCYIKTCFNAPQSYDTHQQCNNYLQDCTLSQKGYGCDIIMQTCNQYTNQIQCKYSIQNECEWQNNQCIIKTCLTANENINYNQGCINYMSNCILKNNKQGCINKFVTCQESLIQENCILDICHWDNNQCLNNECSSYTTNCILRKTPIKCINNSDQTQCINVPNNCNDLPNEYCIPSQSIQLNNKYCILDNNICIDLILQNDCNLYDSSDTCITKIGNKSKCIWNDTTCYNDDCLQLPNTLTTTLQCQQIIQRCILNNTGTGCRDRSECINYNNNNCDQQDLNQNNCAYKDGQCQKKSCATSTYTTHDQCYEYITIGTKCTVNQNLNGCMELSSCSQYKKIEQCVINYNQKECIWQGNTCLDKICTTNVTATNHQECQIYKNTCTFNINANIGCMEFLECSQITDTEICLSNQLCVFISGSCQQKTCENALLDIYDETNCNLLPFNNCSYQENYCTTKTCSYYQYTTDVECLQQDQNCTTNGKTCTERLFCKDAIVEDACQIDRFGVKCQWIENTKKCVNRNCSTAPTTLTTEQQCLLYYNGCTTKSGGGCIIKSTCENADTQAACNSSITGDICQWDDSYKQCRQQKCKDFNGNDYKICNKQKSNCTTNGLNKCTEINECSTYINQLSCIIGLDGPCLWIDNKCQQYNDCTSLKSSNHQICQNLSKNCTTNGTTCITISECNENNINGCFIGIDGECILTLNDKNNKVCTTFTKCSQSKFQTHIDCNQANIRCTTDKTQCIELLQCKDYKFQEQCYLDLNGIQYQNNLIKSNGICKWDQSNCRLQICTDLLGITHQECNQQLMNCTSNGTTCIQMALCSTYTVLEQCNIAYGTDGKCIYITESSKCKIMTCNDITNNQCNIINGCITDGTKCLIKSTCSSYLTKIACDNNGTDGQCVWDSIKSKCLLFSNCSIPTDQSYCYKFNTFCYWNQETTKCIDLTCDLQYKQKNICQYIEQQNGNQIKTCSLINGICQEIDPSNYSIDNCYQNTKYTYTFNNASQKCIKCSTINNNQTNNNTQNQTNQTIDSYQTLLLFLIFQIFILLN